MNINLPVERLILDGLPVEKYQAFYVHAAVEAELRRILTEHGLASYLQYGGTTPSINGNLVPLSINRNPAHIGTQIAQSVYGGIWNNR
jgi:hypothetical protein